MSRKKKHTDKHPSNPNPSNVIPRRWSTRPIIDSDDPDHQEQIQDDPRSLAEDLIMAVCFTRAGRGLPLGEFEHMNVEDIEHILVRGDEITFTLKPGR